MSQKIRTTMWFLCFLSVGLMHCSCTKRSDEEFMFHSTKAYFCSFAQTVTFSRVTEVGHWISIFLEGKTIKSTEIQRNSTFHPPWSHWSAHRRISFSDAPQHYLQLFNLLTDFVLLEQQLETRRMSPKISNEARCPSSGTWIIL